MNSIMKLFKKKSLKTKFPKHYYTYVTTHDINSKGNSSNGENKVKYLMTISTNSEI